MNIDDIFETCIELMFKFALHDDCNRVIIGTRRDAFRRNDIIIRMRWQLDDKVMYDDYYEWLIFESHVEEEWRVLRAYLSTWEKVERSAVITLSANPYQLEEYRKEI